MTSSAQFMHETELLFLFSIVIAKENGHETVVKQLMDHGATFPTSSAV